LLDSPSGHGGAIGAPQAQAQLAGAAEVDAQAQALAGEYQRGASAVGHRRPFEVDAIR